MLLIKLEELTKSRYMLGHLHANVHRLYSGTFINDDDFVRMKAHSPELIAIFLSTKKKQCACALNLTFKYYRYFSNNKPNISGNCVPTQLQHWVAILNEKLTFLEIA